MLKQLTKPNHAFTILYPPVSKEKKNEPKTEYAIQNKLHKKTHRFQK